MLSLTKEYNITPPPAEPSLNIGNNRYLMVGRLSKKNVSKNGDQTKQRVVKIWQSSSKRDKIRAKNLASNIHATIKNITETGKISEKTTIALAHSMNVSPFYLTGEDDEYGNCNEDIIKVFLMKSGYKNILEQNVKSENDNNDNNNSDEISSIVANESDNNDINQIIKEEADIHKNEHIETNKSIDITPVDSTAEIQSIADNLTEEEIITLMRAIMIRSKTGKTNISEIAKNIKLLLLLN